MPCPPFTIAGKQLGATDERDLFAWAIEHYWGWARLLAPWGRIDLPILEPGAGQVRVRINAQVDGDVTTDSFALEAGARFEGRSKRNAR